MVRVCGLRRKEAHFQQYMNWLSVCSFFAGTLLLNDLPLSVTSGSSSSTALSFTCYLTCHDITPSSLNLTHSSFSNYPYNPGQSFLQLKCHIRVRTELCFVISLPVGICLTPACIPASTTLSHTLIHSLRVPLFRMYTIFFEKRLIQTSN